MSFRKALIASYLCIILLLAGGAVAPLIEFQRARARAQELSRADVELETALRVHRNLLPFRDQLQRSVTFENPAAVATSVAALRQELDRGVRDLRTELARTSGDATHRMLIESIIVHLASTIPAQLDDVLAFTREGDWISVRGRTDQQTTSLIQRTADFSVQVRETIEHSRSEALALMQLRQVRALRILLAVIMLTLAAASGLGIWVVRRVSHSLQPLTEGATALARGDFSHRVPALPDVELGPLAAAFNNAAEQLEVLYGAVRESELRFRSLFENAPIPYLEIMPEGPIQRLNRAAAELLGGHEELTGKLIWNFVAQEDVAAVQAACQDVAAGLTPPSGFPQARILSDGGPVPVEIYASSIVESGGVRTIRLAVIDVSERTRLENELHHAQKMEAIGRLAGGVAHDFNNALTVISGWTEILLLDSPPDSPQAEHLRQIAGASAQAASLTRQLLAFSRKQSVKLALLELDRVVQDGEKMMRRLVGEDISFTTRLGASGVHILSDPGQIQQLLANLVVNARDAMPQGGHLTIETEILHLDAGDSALPADAEPGLYASLVVSDTGTGMDETTRSRIFEPFFTTKAPGKGTGLGLATVYGVVRQSGGWLDVTSQLGQGTRFCARFPVRLADQPAVAIPAPSAIAEGHGEQILLVEDQEDVRLLEERMLRQLGYRVISLGDPRLAAQTLQSQSVDLLVTDIVMPGLSGTELATRLRQLQPGLRVLFVSGYYDDSRLPRLDADSGSEILLKPFSPQQLAPVLRRLLDTRPPA